MAEIGFDPFFLLRIALINSQKTAGFVWLNSSLANCQRAPGGRNLSVTYPCPSHQQLFKVRFFTFSFGSRSQLPKYQSAISSQRQGGFHPRICSHLTYLVHVTHVYNWLQTWKEKMQQQARSTETRSANQDVPLLPSPTSLVHPHHRPEDVWLSTISRDQKL